MGLRLYDTLTRAKVDFVPADPKRVTMYVCGPTVYARAHIGNARPAVVFDVLARLLRHTYGNEHLFYARNITDIDDKIMAAAAAEGSAIDTVARRFEAHYLADMGALGVAPPDHAPHATDYIATMVEMIGELVGGGHAYAAEGHVLFDTASAPDYGRLSRRALDEMIAGARVEVAPYKRSPADFVLWKPSTPEQAGWSSPWGRGRPGWHIECSAMIRSVLGNTIDIHGGGLDLIFPHHENELAQSACVNDAPLARMWMHNGFLAVGGDKMSKSAGKIATVDELVAAAWSGDELRLALLSAHYRQPLDWSHALLEQTKATLTRWRRVLDAGGDNATDADSCEALIAVDPAVLAALHDDLNTPLAMAALSALANAGEAAALRSSLALLGLQPKPLQSVDADISAKVEARQAARARRDFVAADRIRDELAKAGVVIEDGASGTSWHFV